MRGHGRILPGTWLGPLPLHMPSAIPWVPTGPRISPLQKEETGNALRVLLDFDPHYLMYIVGNKICYIEASHDLNMFLPGLELSCICGMSLHSSRTSLAMKRYNSFTKRYHSQVQLKIEASCVLGFQAYHISSSSSKLRCCQQKGEECHGI